MHGDQCMQGNARKLQVLCKKGVWGLTFRFPSAATRWQPATMASAAAQIEHFMSVYSLC